MKKNEILKFPLKEKYVAMLAPSFVADFDYPLIIVQLKKLGFDKVVELTFGAKMINRVYHKDISRSKKFIISSVCPGIVETIKKEFPEYKKNLAKINSPMIATAKICKKVYPKHKIVFISPCQFKKVEAEKSEFVNFVICYDKLKELFKQYKIKKSYKKFLFDKFYNDYTKIYPIPGGLSKTAHLRGILKNSETRVIDGIEKVKIFLDNPKKEVRFVDATFCVGGCIGGPCFSSNSNLSQRKKRVLEYLEKAKNEDIPEPKKGLIRRASCIPFRTKNFK